MYNIENSKKKAIHLLNYITLAIAPNGLSFEDGVSLMFICDMCHLRQFGGLRSITKYDYLEYFKNSDDSIFNLNNIFFDITNNNNNNNKVIKIDNKLGIYYSDLEIDYNHFSQSDLNTINEITSIFNKNKIYTPYKYFINFCLPLSKNYFNEILNDPYNLFTESKIDLKYLYEYYYHIETDLTIEDMKNNKHKWIPELVNKIGKFCIIDDRDNKIGIFCGLVDDKHDFYYKILLNDDLGGFKYHLTTCVDPIHFLEDIKNINRFQSLDKLLTKYKNEYERI